MSLAELLEHANRELEHIVKGNEPQECKPARVIELCEEIMITLFAQHATSPDDAKRIASLFNAVFPE